MPHNILSQLITKYNICIDWYIKEIELIEKNESKFLDSNNKYSEILTHVKKTLLSEDKNKQKEIFQFIKTTLSKFSKTYDVDVINNVDDFKLLYFITLYFIRKDETTQRKETLNILFLVLHKLFSSLLIVKKPRVILYKFDRFFRIHNYTKIKDEYGDIGYYHTMKSIYLMQKDTYEYLITKEFIAIEDTFVKNYFKGSKNAE